MKGKFAEQKSYGFKNFEKLEVQIFFFKITAGRTVFNFSCQTSGFELVFSLFKQKNDTFLLKVPSLARSMPKPLNFPSLNCLVLHVLCQSF